MRELKFFGRFIDTAERWANLCGVWLVVFLMLMVTTDVGYRSIFGRSIPGTFELAELTMVGIVFFSVAYAQRERAHIRMDMIVTRLRGDIRNFAEIIAWLLLLAICILLLYEGILEALEAVEMKLTTPGIILWPAWPAKIVVPVGYFLLCVRVAIQLTQQIRLVLAATASK